MNRNILITGIHRSGSTFVGKMISLGKNINYIQEPFNKENGVEGVDVWFKYLNDNTYESKYDLMIKNFINLEPVKYKKKYTNNGNILVRKFKNTIKFALTSKSQLRYDWIRIKPSSSKRLLLKDPIACLASDYLNRKYNFQVIILIRHPLGFVSSLKRLDWHFDFNNFLKQKYLMENYLFEYEEEIKDMTNRNTSIIEEGTLIWKCIYSILFDYISNNEDLIPIRHEDICRNPKKEFIKIFNLLNIPWNSNIENEIMSYNMTTKVEAENNKTHDFHRDSKSLIKQWKKRLTESEQEYIKNETYNLAQEYYSDESWK